MDSVIEVTGCKSNVTETFDTQKDDGEAGEQKTKKTSGGKNVDCVIFFIKLYKGQRSRKTTLFKSIWQNVLQEKRNERHAL